MIGQRIGLVHLVPLALHRVRDDPLVSGDYFAGDLLANVLRIEPCFWQQSPRLRDELRAVVDAVAAAPRLDRHMNGELRELIGRFSAERGGWGL